MRWYYKLPLRLRSLFRKDKAELDLSEELQFHLQNQIDEYVAQGMGPQEARHAAFRSLGGVEQVKEECREARRMNLIENFMRDLRLGLRMLRRNPGFTVLVILCLTLGIGANTAVFSWVEGILLRPYPLVSDQERLVTLTGTVRDTRDETSWPDLLDVRRSCTLCETLFVSKITGATLSIGERAQVITGSIVSANYFDAIGVHPILGRGFEPDEGTGRNAHPVVVISYHFWQSRFQGDPEIIGKTQRFDNVVHTIIGVMPEGFYGTFVGRAMEYWAPLSMLEVYDAGSGILEDRGARWAEAFLRLKPGVNRNQAQQEISAIAARLEAEYPATNRGRGIKLWPLWATPFNHAGHLLATLEIMVVVAMFVLLIVCANVGNLLLVRALARRHEMTVRLAMGASRARLLRQLVTEGLLLSAFGAAGGMLVAYWCRHALVLFFPGGCVVPARTNRRLRARTECGHLPRCYAYCWADPRVPDAPPCPCRHAQNRGIRRYGGARPRMVPLEPRGPASRSQLHLAGGRELADAKPKQDSKHQPGLLHNARVEYVDTFGRRRL